MSLYKGGTAGPLAPSRPRAKNRCTLWGTSFHKTRVGFSTEHKEGRQKKKKKFEMDRAQTNVEGGESGDLQVTTHFMLYFISAKVSTSDFLDGLAYPTF